MPKPTNKSKKDSNKLPVEINTVKNLREVLKEERSYGKSIGFVPTMGYFHEGHLTLMREARKRTDIVVVSIFVNPTQFGHNEDLDKYPRDINRDRQMAGGAGVDYLFIPAVGEIYPGGYATYVNVGGGLDEVLCGKNRPGHFRGVATVVAKLLNIVQPDIAFFGEKDWQQLTIIKRLVHDLNIDVEIAQVPTVREEDGLAMSSRNSYLSPGERKAALVISRALKQAGDMARKGENDGQKITASLRQVIAKEGTIELDYLEICDPESLAPVEDIKRGALVAIAAKAGSTRLIDNTIIRPKLE